MSGDIRSYFSPISGVKKKDGKIKQDVKDDNVTRHRKRQLIVLDSDSDEEPLPLKTKKQKSVSVSTSRHEEDKEKRCASTTKPELKPVNVADVFGSGQIKRTVSKKTPRKDHVGTDVVLQLENQHSDSDFEATLQQIDTIEDSYEKEKKKTLVKERHKQTPDKKETPTNKSNDHIPDKKETPTKENQKHNSFKETSSKREHKHTPDKPKHNENVTESYKLARKETKDNRIENGINAVGDKIGKKEKEADKHTHISRSSSELSTKSKKSKHANTSVSNEVGLHDKEKHFSPVLKSSDSFSDDDFEKKRLHALQYQKYLHRDGPKNPGGKEIPEGKPGCLSGLVFVVTGVLETIDREETSSLIKQYGGKVTSNVSRNTSYLVLGDEPGPSKIEKAMKLNTKQLTEDGLLDLIHNSSGSPGKLITPTKSKKNDIKKDMKLDNSCINKQGHLKSISKTIKTEDIKKERKTAHEFSTSTSPPKSIAASASGDTTVSCMWVDKYKPVSTKQIIGQQGDRSNVKKLLKWLQNWHSNHSGKKKLVRPSPWAKDDYGSFFKAALLSGPPGVGKTTSAHLVCKELGFDVVEFNASDTRSKKLLHEEVSELLSSKSLSGYFQGSAGKKPTENHVLVMDEVDGMAGNEDRGGVQELIQLIKNSHVPVICMCNDRHHPKIRSLTNYCFDLQFSRPRVEQIRGAMMSICFKEGIKIVPEALNDVITGANHDVRQILHHMSMWSVKNKQLSVAQAKEESQKAKKNIKLGPWDVLKKVFSADAHKSMSIHDRSDLFFHDYSLGPLFVQENYLGVMPHSAKGNKKKHLELVARTAESLSSGDLVEKAIRSRNAWSLLPTQAMFSSVLPGDLMEGHMTRQINFPSWLGKNSRRSKYLRLLQELHMHMRLKISGSREAVNLDYLLPIRDSLIGPLIKDGSEGVPATLDVMQNYYLTREDIDSVLELSLWPNQKDPMSLVDSKVKAALTRTYNKQGFMTPYSLVHIKKTSAKSSQDMEFDDNGEDVVDEEEEEEKDNVGSDAMIKAKKRPASRSDAAAGGTSSKRAKTSNKGKTKKNDKGKEK